MKINEVLTEAFNTPYPLTWEESEHGHHVARTKLSDGTNLRILFNKGYSDDFEVQFDRNHSMEVTYEGDAQRIFATVLSAIQQFINKVHPWRLKFSANKKDFEGSTNQSRAKLYIRLVARYAREWGYHEHNAEYDNEVRFTLTRIE